MANGYIQKESSTCWIARVEHYRNGKRRYVSKAFPTEKEAKEHLQNQQSAKNNGEFIEPSKVTLAVLFDEWLDTIRPRVTQRTAEVIRAYSIGTCDQNSDQNGSTNLKVVIFNGCMP